MMEKSCDVSFSRSSCEIVCAARMQAYMLMLPVITSLPELNSSPVHVGSLMRMVMAAKRLRSYRELGSSNDTRWRSMCPVEHSICDVLTMLWQTGTGNSPPSSSANARFSLSSGIYVRLRMLDS
eukprot:3807464-Rhodomonas_salina.1